MRKRLETMHRHGRGLCSGAMLAGQRLTGQFGQHFADGAPLPPCSFSHGAQDVIIDRQRGAHASDANTSHIPLLPAIDLLTRKGPEHGYIAVRPLTGWLVVAIAR